ncbi:anti-sigma factor [Mycobacterium sp.]|uniref:anti-sigma factor n=1 Tax=Mycobacterium sp. TaxID=1785 RepID=UPI003D10B960
MTEPTGFDLLELATPYALQAISDAEHATVDRQLTAAAAPVANAFRAEVRAIRETMALVSAVTAVEPPTGLRTAVLAAAQSEAPRLLRWRTLVLAAAAAIIVALAAFGVGVAMRPAPSPTMTEQIMAAPDKRTVSGQLAGGIATVVFSRNMNAGVLTLNDVPPPSQGTVYQMWLIDDKGPASAGTMDPAAVAPSKPHLLRDLGRSGMLAFTVEPGSGSPKPTGSIIAKLPLG